MLTRSGASVRRRRDAAIGTIGLLERRTAVLESKASLTEDDRQSALRMNGLLSSVTADFKNYHFTLIDSIEDDEEVQREQTTLHEHELKVMELVDRLGHALDQATPQETKKAIGKIGMEVAPDFIDNQCLTRFTDKAIEWMQSQSAAAKNGKPRAIPGQPPLFAQSGQQPVDTNRNACRRNLLPWYLYVSLA